MPASVAPDGGWRRLDDPWRTAFELAWESWSAGSLGIGAVVVDAGGMVATTGRNRIYEQRAPTNRMAGTFIAHAEVDALAGLAPGRYLGHTIFTTLEPCLLCWGAIRLSRVGKVRFAAPDPLWRPVADLLTSHADTTRWWPSATGPEPGALAALGALLPLVHHIERQGPSGTVAAGYGSSRPELVHFARDLAGSRWLRTVADDGATAEEVFGELWRRYSSYRSSVDPRV